MTITKLERQKKDKRRWNLYVDGGFAFGLYEDTLLKYGLSAKEEVTQKLLDEIKEFDEFVYAKKTAFDYLSYRIRTVDELRKKLNSRKISAGTADRVVAYLMDLGLLDDEQFAKELIESSLKKGTSGRRLIKQKLYRKGVPQKISEKVLTDIFSGLDEKALVLENFRKYFSKIKGLDRNKQRKKAFDHLLRKGFDLDVITEVIRENLKE